MKKIIFLIMTMLVFTSCLTKVNVDNKGDLNLSIKWPESSDSKSVSKALLSGTDKVEIYLNYNGDQHMEPIIRIIENVSSGNTYSVEFADLLVGEWTISVNTYSGSTQNGSYSDTITISNDNPTYVTHKFGSPQKITSLYYDLSASYINDGAENVTAGVLAVYSTSSSYMNEPSYDQMNIELVISKYSDFRNNIYEITYPIGSTQMPVSPGTLVEFFIGDSPYILESNTKYYWKILETNSIATTESKVFSFTTLP